jgi:hypothetical protein
MNDLPALFAPDDRRDLLRKLGGLLLAAGLLLVFVRKSALGEPWGDWALLITLLIPFAFLYGVGLVGRQNTPELRPWESVYLVFGILVAPLVLFQFIEAINGTPGASLNVFWIFLVTAGLAAAAAVVAGVRYGLLLASIAVIVSWSALWNKILSDGLGEHIDLYRVLLLILAALLLVAAMAASTTDEEDGRSRASEIVTGASIAAVLAGAFSIAMVAELSNPLISVSGVKSSFFWELVLLLASLASIAYGARLGARGPAYVGGFGLFAFLFIAGLDLDSSTPDAKIVGWPLGLLLIGLAAFVASLRAGGPVRGVGSGPGGEAPVSPPTQPPPGSPPG